MIFGLSDYSELEFQKWVTEYRHAHTHNTHTHIHLFFFDFLFFWFFDFFVNWEVVHTSYLNEGYYSTDKDFQKFIILYTKSYYNSISGLGWNLKNETLKTNKRIKEFDDFYFYYCNNESSSHLILVVFTLFSKLRHLHKTGNGIIAFGNYTMSSSSVFHWPLLR